VVELALYSSIFFNRQRGRGCSAVRAHSSFSKLSRSCLTKICLPQVVGVVYVTGRWYPERFRTSSTRRARTFCAITVLTNDKLDIIIVDWNNDMVKPPKARDHDPMTCDNRSTACSRRYCASWDCVTADKALGVDEYTSSHLSDTHTHEPASWLSWPWC
jgi:hypothetical protein